MKTQLVASSCTFGDLDAMYSLVEGGILRSIEMKRRWRPT